MAHFAKLDENNIVTQVIVINNLELDPENEEQSGLAWLETWSGGYTKWKQTSYNGSFRVRFAAIGGTYDEEYDVFWSPKPFPSWIKDYVSYKWKAPVPYPTDDHKDGLYDWDETTLSWISTKN